MSLSLLETFYSRDMQEMEKAQAKGEIDAEELRALEMDVTGKVRINMLFNLDLT